MSLTQRTLDWEVQFYEADDSTVAFTLPLAEMAAIPGTVGGQEVRPAEGRAEGAQWYVDVLDRPSQGTNFVSRLSDSDGNAHLANRKVALRRNLDGAGMATIATGRCVSISDTGNPLVFRVHMSDERTKERRIKVFTYADTATIFPGGLRPDKQVYFPAPNVARQLWKVKAVSGQRVDLELQVSGSSENQHEADDLAVQVLSEDVLPDRIEGQGNFLHSRFRTGTVTATNSVSWGSVDHEIEAFKDARGLDAVNIWLIGAESLNRNPENIRNIRLQWSGTAPSVGQTFAGFIHAPTRPPDELLPLHIGHMDVENYLGTTTGLFHVCLPQLIRDLYTGKYQNPTDTDVQTVAYESAAFSAYDPVSNPVGLIGHPNIPLTGVRLRITRSWELYEFAEAVYQALGLVGFVNSTNEVAPRPVLLPDENYVDDPVNLPLVDDSVIRADSPPSWSQSARTRYTVVRYHYAAELFSPLGPITGPVFPSGNPFNGPGFVPTSDPIITQGYRTEGLDYIGQAALVHEVTHPDVGTLGRYVLDIDVTWLHSIEAVQQYAAWHSKAVFDRWAYGEIATDVAVLESAPALEPGDLIRFQSDMYPNLAIQARGGTRVMQVLQTPYDASGRKLELLDVGANLQPIATPTLSAAANSSFPGTHIDVTVGSLPAGASWEIHAAANATEPAEGDAAWQSVKTGMADGNYTIGPFPSTTIWLRIRAHAVGRISSGWSTAVSVALTALAAPTSLSVTNITGSTADFSWTVAYSYARLEVRIDDGGTPERVALLPAGTQRYTFRGLALSTSYTAHVRHLGNDGFPGTDATSGFATTGTLPTLLTPGLAIIKGVSVGDRTSW